MRRFRAPIFSGAIFVPVALLVTVLAVLQYRWSSQISEATSVRLADSLQMSMINWHQDLFRDLSQICFIFEANDRSEASDAASPSAWRAVSSYPDLIANVYLVDDAAGLALSRLNPATGRFEAVNWPTSLRTVRDRLQRDPGILSAGPDAPDTPAPSRGSPYRTGLLQRWFFEPSVPALLHPVVKSNQPGIPVRWLVVQLDAQVIRDKVLPGLAQRYFQGTNGLDFQVAVIGDAPRQVMYSSDGGFGAQRVTDADGTLNIFGRASSENDPAPIEVFHDTSRDTGPASALDVTWFPLFSSVPGYADWRLFVRHRRGGPLGAFAAELRRRNLALSFGILFLLVASMGMLMITARRAQFLARMQMDFVTTVSHELRTPLTVINTAADNIARGFVESRDHVVRYGALIQTQGRRLAGLVEQVLLFASTRQGKHTYAFQELDINRVIAAALEQAHDLANSSECIIEQDIDPALPTVWGDAAALSQCLQNLISNAVKYGGEEKWLGIAARYEPSTHEVEIAVSDRGIGIAAQDLPHIFEPFYRSPAVAAAQFHGTGIGLALARTIVDAMKGRLSVVSIPGKGSTFTLRLPCTKRGEQPVPS